MKVKVVELQFISVFSSLDSSPLCCVVLSYKPTNIGLKQLAHTEDIRVSYSIGFALFLRADKAFISDSFLLPGEVVVGRLVEESGIRLPPLILLWVQ